jgi:hypothetical protein
MRCESVKGRLVYSSQGSNSAGTREWSNGGRRVSRTVPSSLQPLGARRHRRRLLQGEGATYWDSIVRCGSSEASARYLSTNFGCCASSLRLSLFPSSRVIDPTSSGSPAARSSSGTLQLRAVHQLDIADRRLRRRFPIRQPNPVLQRLNKRFLVGLELVGKAVADSHAAATTTDRKRGRGLRQEVRVPGRVRGPPRRPADATTASTPRGPRPVTQPHDGPPPPCDTHRRRSRIARADTAAWRHWAASAVCRNSTATGSDSFNASAGLSPVAPVLAHHAPCKSA